MNLTSEKLYELCKKYGRQARLWRQKFIGLLPEVNRRRLYEEKRFGSIFEFATKLCGLSAPQVNLALSLGKRFENMPILKGMFENGEVSINKLVRIASIATPENEEELAAKVKFLSKSALATWVRDVKASWSGATTDVVPCSSGAGQAQGSGDQIQMHVFEGADGSSKPSFAPKTLPGQNIKPACGEANFQFDEDVLKELNELNFKGIDVNALLREMLKRRKEEIANKKAEIAKNLKPTTSHYVEARIKKVLKEEYGKKCSIPTCSKPAQVLHHMQRFSLSHNHDPYFLMPLCEDHHEITHSIDLKYQQMKERSCIMPA